MKVRLPFVIQDQLTAEAKGMEPIRGFDWDSDKHEREVFLDGPVSTRLAVLDFDEQSGELHRSVPFVDVGALKKYDVRRTIDDRKLQAVSVFATVLKTLAMYESDDVLGRRVEWSFDGPQLLIVPRAGTWQNAFYERESHSLQFFSFPGDERRPVVHTSLSLDIVSHETGHAVLDAIAPHLYDCVTPQSLAIHEAIGDLTTLFMSLDVRDLAERLLNQTGGNIKGINAYTQVAEEFGFYTGRDGALRSLWNQETMASIPDHNDFHDLSQVLTGAVYELLVGIYESRWRAMTEGGPPELSRSGKALWTAARAVRRIALRGLDYLPPGEVTFADYGRAVIAADAVASPDNPVYRHAFADILESRGVGSAASLRFVSPDHDLLPDVDLDALATSDWHAYELVNAHRDAFHVPADVAFRVEPRLRVCKKTWRREGEVTYREFIMKVSWENLEDAGRKIWARFGTTMVFDGDSGKVIAVVTTNPAVTRDNQDVARRAFVEHLLDQDLVAEPDRGLEVLAHTDEGIRVLATGRCLHLSRQGDPPIPADAGSEHRPELEDDRG